MFSVPHTPPENILVLFFLSFLRFRLSEGGRHGEPLFMYVACFQHDPHMIHALYDASTA